MARKGSFGLFRLLVLLSSIVIYIACTKDIVAGNSQAFSNFRYECYSNNSFLGQSLVRNKLLCAAECMHHPMCRTATFNKVNHYCSLYTEFTELGKLIQNNDMITFRRQSKYVFQSLFLSDTYSDLNLN